MKFSTILVLYLSAMAASPVLAAPLRHSDRCSPGGADVRCIGHSDEHALLLDPSFNGGNALSIHARGLTQTLKSIIEGLPIIGPILAPLLGSLLGAIGLSELDVASASDSTLNAEQIGALATFELALSNAAHKVLLSSGTPKDGAQSKLKARGSFPLGEVTAGVPLIGPFLRPVTSLLESLGLGSVNATPSSVFSSGLLSEYQSAKLAQFRSILQQEIENILPDVSDTTPSDVPLPSKASPDDVEVSPTPSPGTSEDDDSNRSTPSPDDASPADVPVATPVSSPAPK